MGVNEALVHKQDKQEEHWRVGVLLEDTWTEPRCLCFTTRANRLSDCRPPQRHKSSQTGKLNWWIMHQL